MASWGSENCWQLPLSLTLPLLLPQFVLGLPVNQYIPNSSFSLPTGQEQERAKFCWPTESSQKVWQMDLAKPHHTVFICWGWTISLYPKTTMLGCYDPHCGKWGSPALLRTPLVWTKAQRSRQAPWMAAGLTLSQLNWEQIHRIQRASPSPQQSTNVWMHICVHVYMKTKKKKAGKASTLRFSFPQKRMLKKKTPQQMDEVFNLVPSPRKWAQIRQLLSSGAKSAQEPQVLLGPFQLEHCLGSSHPNQKQAGRNIMDPHRHW